MVKVLLIIEHGGLPVYPRDLVQMGYAVETVHSQRKALSALKSKVPDVVVAEFNYVSTFRDRISNLESLLARLQTNAPDTKVIVIYEQEHEEHLSKIKQRFVIHEQLRYPVTAEHFFEALRQTVGT